MYNRLILVTGTGTSGAAMFTGMLSALGARVPQPEVGVAPGAPRGFGEPQWVVNLHSKLLRRVSVQTADARPSAWALVAAAARERSVQTNLENWLHGEFKKSDHVVIKEPRLMWFIPAWRRAGETLAAPCFVTILRHPLEVISSKEPGYSEDWSPNARTAGWINSMLYSERATRGDRRAIVRHEDLKSDGMLAVSRASEVLDLEIVNRPSPPQMRVATDLVEPSPRSSVATWKSLEVDHRLVELAEEVHRVLGEASGVEIDGQKVQTSLDDLRQRYVDLYRFAESTAQFSIAAGGRGGGGSASSSSNGSVLSPEVMRKVLLRAKRRGKQKIHQLRLRRKTAVSGGGSSTSREGG